MRNQTRFTVTHVDMESKLPSNRITQNEKLYEKKSINCDCKEPPFSLASQRCEFLYLPKHL